ncbi:MAG: YHYH protein [Flavobacteriales bacterium]|nr:YHYH protein [Flavobacteriales bacterium]
MKIKLLTVLGLAATMVASAQSPELEAWMFNTHGNMGYYEFYPATPPTIDSEDMFDSTDVKALYYDDDNFYVRAEGLASYTMGPWEQNPNVPSGQDYVFKITRNPVEEKDAKTSTPFGGSQGVCINGVVMYGYGDGKSYSFNDDENSNMGDGNWDGDAWISEGVSMDDTGGGHADGSGRYHYHATPFSLYVDPNTGHSVIIGYAYDGFPIYGPYGYVDAMEAGSGVERMTSGYALRGISTRDILPDGTTSDPVGPDVTTNGDFDIGTYVQDYMYDDDNGSLDEYNGRMCVTPEYPEGTYAYFLSTDDSGDPEFPYILAGSYYGELSNSDLNNAGDFTLPTSGLTIQSIFISVAELEAIGVSVYPNPTADVVNVSTTTIAQSITIVSSAGQIVSSVNPTSTQTAIDVSDLANGIYIISINSNNTVATQKLVISE